VTADFGRQAIAWALGVWVVVACLIWLMTKKDSKKSGPVSPAIAGSGTVRPESLDGWSQLIDQAGDTVRSAVAELPDDVRAEAETVPVLFEEQSENERPGRTILGLYRGFIPNQVSARKGPIVLYLRSIEAYVGGSGAAFNDQVRRTFLHELGHHLGWGETDVRARGL
jgi:predicted Zn-dependent protease with MMP-like domain